MLRARCLRHARRSFQCLAFVVQEDEMSGLRSELMRRSLSRVFPVFADDVAIHQKFPPAAKLNKFGKKKPQTSVRPSVRPPRSASANHEHCARTRTATAPHRTSHITLYTLFPRWRRRRPRTAGADKRSRSIPRSRIWR